MVKQGEDAIDGVQQPKRSNIGAAVFDYVFAAFAMRTGVDPDVEVKSAAVALIVLRRLPQFGALPFSELVDAPDAVRQPSPLDDMTLEQQVEFMSRMAAV